MHHVFWKRFYYKILNFIIKNTVIQNVLKIDCKKFTDINQDYYTETEHVLYHFNCNPNKLDQTRIKTFIKDLKTS